MENHEILEKIIQLKRNLGRIYGSVKLKTSLNRTELIIFMIIGENNGISPGKLSNLTGFSKSLITISITNLENAGLIKRKRASDRRKIEIEITKKGMEKFLKIKDNVDKNFNNMISKLSKEEIESLSQCLDKMLSIIEKL
ncbi:MAG: MarR family winged helix-turn-helix transcriptional regulator [Thermoplasmata archaeon]|nr:MarR family transcriptional regulator [Thermoplasmata archaeon]